MRFLALVSPKFVLEQHVRALRPRDAKVMVHSHYY
jgi:hypothetical protein